MKFRPRRRVVAVLQPIVVVLERQHNQRCPRLRIRGSPVGRDTGREIGGASRLVHPEISQPVLDRAIDPDATKLLRGDQTPVVHTNFDRAALGRAGICHTQPRRERAGGGVGVEGGDIGPIEQGARRLRCTVAEIDRVRRRRGRRVIRLGRHAPHHLGGASQHVPFRHHQRFCRRSRCGHAEHQRDQQRDPRRASTSSCVRETNGHGCGPHCESLRFGRCASGAG